MVYIYTNTRPGEQNQWRLNLAWQDISKFCGCSYAPGRNGQLANNMEVFPTCLMTQLDTNSQQFMDRSRIHVKRIGYVYCHTPEKYHFMHGHVRAFMRGKQKSGTLKGLIYLICVLITITRTVTADVGCSVWWCWISLWRDARDEDDVKPVDCAGMDTHVAGLPRDVKETWKWRHISV